MTNDAQKIVFRRGELYEQVWKTPVTQLARELGISDVGFAKICKRLKVPKPPIGHWAKVKHGKKVYRPPLPKLDPGESEVYTYNRPVRSPTSVEIGKEIMNIPEAASVIAVPDHLESPHPLVKATKAVLKQTPRDKYGMLSLFREGCLTLRIGPDSVKRALILLDTILKEFKRLGFRITTTAEPKVRNRIEINGEDIPFMLLEEARQANHVMTAEEKSRQKAGSLWSLPKWDYVPSGCLQFVLDVWGVRGIRKQWPDSSKRRLEEKIGDIIKGTVLVAHALKNERIRQEEEDKNREEERKRREEVEKQRAAEDARLRDLEKQAEIWAKTQQLRAFIQAVESLAVEKQFPDDTRQWFAKWIAWAKDHADRLDPLRELKAK